MAKLTLAQIEYLSQEITSQFKDVKYLTVEACCKLEYVQQNLRNLITTYEQWLTEEGLDREEL